MPSKRRNNGRSKKNRGHVKPVVCTNCARLVPKDKAIKRFNVRDIVDASSKRDIKDATAYSTFIIPKLYTKLQYCIACAIHARIVRVRSAKDRRVREAPKRVQREERPQTAPKEKKPAQAEAPKEVAPVVA
jgi:small subunit ribosomal protein S26e